MPQRRRGAPKRKPGASFVEDPLTGQMAELQRVQPFQANKQYICPGCNQEIRQGVGHLVVVPLGQPDMRRHWHDPCWAHARRHGHR